MIRSTGRTALWLLAAGAAALASAGCEVSEKAESRSSAPFSITGVHPEFDPAERRYVSRCGRGGPPVRILAGSGAKAAVGAARPRAGTQGIGVVPPGEDVRVRRVVGDVRAVYRIRCLPADFPAWRFERLRPTPRGLFTVSFQASADDRPWVIVFDQGGTPRWWFNPSTRALWAQVLDDGAVSWARSFGDGYGLDPRMAHEIRTLSGRLLRVVRTEGSIIDGHEFRDLPNGNVLTDTYAPGSEVDLRPFGGPSRASAVFAEIHELDPANRVVWRWNSRGHIHLRETNRWWRNVLSNAKRGRGDRETFDPVHINSIEPRGRDEVVISARHTDAIYGIERSSGDVLWKLGGTETPESLRIVGDPASKVFGGQHDARVGPDGTLSVYDNSKARPRLPRVVFYRLDARERTATYLGQLNDPLVKTSHCCGSARPFGDGWLVSWGDNPLVTGFDGDLAATFRLHLAASTYRAVPVPEGAVTPEQLDRGLEAME